MRNKLIGICCCFAFLFFIGFTYASSEKKEAGFGNEQQQDISPYQPNGNNYNPVNTTGTFTLTNKDLGWVGPFSLGISADSLTDFSWNIGYTQKINNYLGVSTLLEQGSDMLRYGGTLGFNLLDKGMFKVSVENLFQVLPFDFDSGTVNERVHQGAIGARYQYAFKNSIWQDINFGGYYAKAPGKELDPVEYTFNGMDAINYRYIAGAESGGFDIGSDFNVTKYTQLTGHIYYDTVNYDTIYNPSEEDARGLGADLGIKQLIGKYFIFNADASLRKTYDDYEIGFSWLPPYLKKAGCEVSILAQRTVSHNETPDSNGIGLQLTFTPSVINAKDTYYLLPGLGTLNDITSWTSAPAVHMSRVLAEVDQMTKVIAPVITMATPDTGPAYGGGTFVTITGQGFIGTSRVYFGGVPASSFTVVSNNTITCVAPDNTIGTVDLIVTNPGGNAKTYFTYYDSGSSNNTSLSVAAISPSSALVNDDKVMATISGANFSNEATVKFGNLPAIVNKVSSSKIEVTVPKADGFYGEVEVSVTNPDGVSVNLPKGFIYLNKTKNNKKLNGTAVMSPTSGPNPGGTVVTITGGSGYNSSTRVFFDFPENLTKEASIQSITNGGTTITFWSPAGGTGPSYVRTVNPSTEGEPFIFYYHLKEYVIEASATAGGTISPSGIKEFAKHDDQTYKITANAGYHIADVLVDGASVGAVTSYTFDNIVHNHTIHAIFAINTFTIVSSVTSGSGTISPLGSTTVNYGADQLYTISPDSGWKVSDVVIDGSTHLGEVYSYSFNDVTSNHTIAVAFEKEVVPPTTFNITSTSGTGGSIDPFGNIVVNSGGSQAYTITPNANYHISDVTVDGVSVGAVASYLFNNVTSNHTINAVFAADQYVITVVFNYGTFSYEKKYYVNYGENKTVLFIPDLGYYITNVLINGSSVGRIGEYTFNNVTQDQNVVVNLDLFVHTIIATAEPHGKIDPAGSVTVVHNRDKAFKIIPDPGFSVKDILIDGVSIGSLASYTFENVTEDHAIHAMFSENIKERKEVVKPSMSGSSQQAVNQHYYKGTTVAIPIKIEPIKFNKPPTKVTFDEQEVEIIKATKESVTVLISPTIFELGKIDAVISNNNESIEIVDMPLIKKAEK